MDRVVMIGMIVTNIAAALTAGLYARVSVALPETALRGWGMVAVALLATTLLNVRVRNSIGADDEGNCALPGFSSSHLVSQFFLALAWVAMLISLVVLLQD